jgi:hypothetical protein
MYEDDKPWPFTCPSCGQHFQKQVGWLKAHDLVRCPTCKLRYEYSREKLSLQIARAREGVFNPLRYIHRAKDTTEFPEGLE